MADLSFGQSAQPVNVVDESGNVTTSTNVSGKQGLDVNVISASISTTTSADLTTSYSPDPASLDLGATSPITVDASGRLESHSAVTTDEGSFRDDYSNAALTTTLTGTPAWINNSTAVTGAGTLFTTQIKIGDYIKKTADAETLYVQVASIESDTALTLETAYTGTTASAASVVNHWKTTVTGTGASIAVASSIATLNSGTANNNIVQITKAGDYLPMIIQFYGSISQRIANQTVTWGFIGASGAQVTVQFTGTTNTTCNLVSGFSSAAADTQTTAATLPTGGVTSANHLYKLDLSTNQATLSIDGVVVASNSQHIPGPYDNLDLVAKVTNQAAVTTTAVALDFIYFTNWDRVQIDNDFTGESVKVTPFTTTDVAAYGTINALNGALTVNTNGTGSTIFQLTGVFVGTFVAEGSINNTDWANLTIFPSSGQSTTTGVTTTGSNRIPSTSAYSQIRIRCSAYTSGTATVQMNLSEVVGAPQIFSPNAQNCLVGAAHVDGYKATYSATSTALALATTPTDVFTLTGSATKTVRITRFYLTGTQTTGNTSNVLIIKRSTANTAGTSTTPTVVPYDSNNAAATAVARAYTANPTLGTAVGTMASYAFYIPAPQPANANSPFVAPDLFAAVRPASGIVLRGAAEVLAVNFNSTTVTGSSINIFIEWTEE